MYIMLLKINWSIIDFAYLVLKTTLIAYLNYIVLKY